jgi:hypothetical protein
LSSACEITCPIRPKTKLHVEEGAKEWGTWLRADQSRQKAFIPGGGEGDFRHSPTRYETGGTVRPGGTEGGAESEFFGTHQLVRGVFLGLDGLMWNRGLRGAKPGSPNNWDS